MKKWLAKLLILSLALGLLWLVIPAGAKAEEDPAAEQIYDSDLPGDEIRQENEEAIGDTDSDSSNINSSNGNGNSNINTVTDAVYEDRFIKMIAAPVTISHAGGIDWEGRYPLAGDQEFYLEVLGKGLLEAPGPLEAEVFVLDGVDFIKVASQTEWRYLGKTDRDEERFIFQMVMDGTEALTTGKAYYINVKDQEGNYLFPDQSYANFYPQGAGSGYIEEPSISKISSQVDKIYLNFNAHQFAPGQSSNDLEIELWQYDEMGWEGPAGKEILMGTMNKENMVLDEIIGCSYRISGEISITGELIPGSNLYLKMKGELLDGTESNAYSFIPIKVLNGTVPTAEPLLIKNAIGDDPERGHEHWQGENSGDPNFFIEQNIDTLEFAFFATAMKETGKISAQLKGGGTIIGSLRPGSVKISPNSHGIDVIEGMVDITGTIPVDGAVLEISYDNILANKAIIKETDLTGVSEIWYGDTSYPYGNTYQLPAAGSIELRLEGTLNILPSAISAWLVNDYDEEVDLTISAVQEDGGITLILTPETGVLGKYTLVLRYAGSPLRQIYYDPFTKTLGNKYELGEGSNALSFEFVTEFDQVLKDMVYDQGDLRIIGSGFDPDRSYQAALIKRVGTALNSDPFLLSASFVSLGELKIAEDDLSYLPRGWYTGYLLGDHEQLKGFADVALLTPEEDNGGPSLILPKAVINNDDKYTTQAAVTLNLSAGSYTQVKFAETEEELAVAPWQDISPLMTYTLSPDYGTKTLIFTFKTSAGELYTLRDSILYRGEGLENMLEFGVADGKILENNTVFLNQYGSYTFFIKSHQFNLTGKVDFCDANNKLIHTEELRRTTGNNQVHTYAKMVTMTGELSTAKILYFYLEDGDGFVSPTESVSVLVSAEAYIAESRTIFKTYNYRQLYVENDSEVHYTLSGTPGFQAQAKLVYLNEAGETVSQDNSLIYDGIKGYSLKKVLPSDAQKIISIEYTLTDPDNGENKAAKTEEKNFEVTGRVNFVGLANEGGDYDGKTLVLYNDDSWYYKSLVISDQKTDFAFPGLRPSDHYRYRIYDNACEYGSGSINVETGKTKVESLSGAKVPAKVQFNVSGGPEKVKISCLVKDTYYERYAENGKELPGNFVGQELLYRVMLSDADAKIYKIPDQKNILLTEKSQTVNITLDKLAKIKVTGTITDEKITGRSISGCVISLYQPFSNGYNFVDYNNTAVTDEAGNYQMEIYSGIPVTMYISKNDYITKTISFTAEADVEKNESLAYNQQNNISINLMTRPLVDQGKGVDDISLLSLDNSNIRGVKVRKSDGITDVNAYYMWYSSSIHIYDKTVSAGDKVRLYFEFSKGFVSEEKFYEVTLDEYLNGIMDVIAIPCGQVTANVLTTVENTPTSYMLLFDQSGTQAAVISGAGNLSSELYALKDGQYTGIIFNGYGLKKMQNIKLLSAFELLGLKENIDYVKKTLTIEQGRRTLLGDIELPELLSDDSLGFTENAIKTKYTPNNGTGELSVMANFNPTGLINTGEVTLRSISINTSATLKDNEVYYDGERYYAKWIYPYDMQNVGGMLYFTLIPPAMEQTTLSITLHYQVGNSFQYETFGVENIDMPKVTILPPAEVFLGENAQQVLVRGIALPESRVEIYDNDILIGETKVPANKTNYQTSVALTYPEQAAGHIMYAKMTSKEGETYISPVKTCELIDPKKAAYTSNFVFDNGNGRVFANNNPHESNFPLTFSYNPGVQSKVSFRINNLLKAQISYAALVSHKEGADTMFEATHKQDVDDGIVRYSEWELNDYLGYLGDLSVYYALAYNEPLAPISGTKEIDFTQAIKKPDLDPASLPPVLLDNLDQRKITEDDNNLDIEIPVAEGSSVRVTGSFSEGHTMNAADLIAEGYRRFETVQGYYWAKESITESEKSLEYHKTIYFSPALTALLKDDGKNVGLVTEVALNENIPMGSYAMSNSEALSKADYAGYVYNIGEIVNDTSANPANLGKIGTGMQIAGGAVLVGQALMGPTSKDHNALYAEAAKVEDVLVKSRLNDEIREYDRARRSAHRVTSLFGGVSYGAGFAGTVGKGLSYLVSTGGMIYDKKTGTELDIWWDAVMRDIQNELTLQERRKHKKEKPNPGKRDEIKRPNWKIDPSGYVFEAIETQRVEGITASILEKNATDGGFYFWDEAEEWEEVNPQITDKEGKYGWDVPQGDWKVRFAGTGYQTSETKAMTVPPAHDQVNIGLLSTRAPEVSGMALDAAGLEVEFDQFMQGETIYDQLKQTENMMVVDSKGKAVPCKQINFLIETANEHYQSGGLYQTAVIEADKFVKRIRFVADDKLYPGGFKEFQEDGVTPETYSVLLNTNVQSYAGVHLAADYQGPALTLGARQKVSAPQPDIPAGTYDKPQQITINTETPGAAIYYTTDGTTPTALSRVYQEPLIITKNTVLKLMASKVGMDESNVTTLSYYISPGNANMIAAAPTADIASGLYQRKQTVTLSTATKGATVYYTTDGTTPTANSALYTSPISVNKTMTIKAIAVKAGYASSPVATFSYTIKEADTPGGGGGNPPKEEPVIEPVPEVTTSQFADISQYDWAKEAILKLAAQGIIKGVSETQFAPAARINRADFVALMVRTFSLGGQVQENFADVAKEKYYYSEIGVAKSLGLIDGLGDNQFNPEGSITRQDMIVIADRIMRAQGLLTEDADVKVLEKFTDYGTISPYAKEAMARMVAQGYILGSGNKINPMNNTTRAETAVFIYRISQLSGNK